MASKVRDRSSSCRFSSSPPGPGKKITTLTDAVIPGVTAPGLSVAEQRAGSKIVPAVSIPPVKIPAVAEGGCIVEYEAPAGCLAKMEISQAWIPGLKLAGKRLVHSEAPSRRSPTRNFPSGCGECTRTTASARCYTAGATPNTPRLVARTTGRARWAD